MSAALSRATSALEHLQRRPISRFLVIGSFVTAVDFTIFNLFLLANGAPSTPYILLANTCAFAVAANVGYQLHSRFTFHAGRDWRSFWTYVVVAVVGITIYNAALFGLLFLVASSHPIALNIAKAGAAVIAAIWNFLGYRSIAFRVPSSGESRRDSSR